MMLLRLLPEIYSKAEKCWIPEPMGQKTNEFLSEQGGGDDALWHRPGLGKSTCAHSGHLGMGGAGKQPKRERTCKKTETAVDYHRPSSLHSAA